MGAMETLNDELIAETAVPRSSRRRAVGVVAAVVLAVATLAGCLSENQKTVQTQINNSRAAARVPALIDYSTADSKAQAWAEHLASIGRLEHSNLPTGYAAGTWCGLAENVGMGPNLSGLHTAFMKSSGHRKNILNRSYTHVGTGVAQSGGYYFVVHEFVDRC